LRRIPLIAALLVGLAACSGGSASPSAAKPGALPTVSGSYGVAPKITFPAGPPPKSLRLVVLVHGTGGPVAKGDLLVANYTGQIWGGKVFDSSFQRKEPIAVPIGVGQVIPGWDKTLVGADVGSRLLLVIPPAEGYGPSGNKQAGITGKDTIVFVVDIIGAYSKTATSGYSAAPQKVPAGLPQVEGAVGQPPTILIPKTVKQPTKQSTVVLDLGSGPPVRPGMVVLEYEAVDWTGKLLESTWSSGSPVGEVIGVSGQPSALDSLVGVPIGSRVLIMFPSQSDGNGGQTGSYAVVADIIAQPPIH
jgi:peptidylprolyl isomerase